MLLPRKELDETGKEIDPRQELVDKILEYKKFKEASARLADYEAVRMLMVKRGNLHKELVALGEEASEGTEIQTFTLYKLMKVFERVMSRVQERNLKPQHVVYKYQFTMEESREFMLLLIQKEKTLPFEKVFEVCQEKLHAIFLFLTVLELVQQRIVNILIGEGHNNFIIEYTP
jgi:segregation and condensation protein A